MKKIYILLFICNSFFSVHAQNKKELNASILRLQSDSAVMSNTLEEKKRIISKNTTKIEELNSLNKSNSSEIDTLKKIITEKEKLIDNNEKLISHKNIIIDSLDIVIHENQQLISHKDIIIDSLYIFIGALKTKLNKVESSYATNQKNNLSELKKLQYIQDYKTKTSSNSGDRTVMLDILRANMYKEFKQELVFAVHHFKGGNNYAWFM